MKNVFLSLAASTALLLSLQSCNKNERAYDLSDSFTISGPNRIIISPNTALTSSVTISQTNFANEIRGEVENTEYEKGQEVTSFTVNKLWISRVRITDYSHIDLDENIDDLNNFVNEFKVFIQDNNLVGEKRLLADGTATGNLNVSAESFYDYSLNYPDYSIVLVSTFQTDPDIRSLLIEVDLGVSYAYETKEAKN